MKGKERKEVVKHEPGRALSPFDEMERWFDDVFRRPFFHFGPSRWSGIQRFVKEELSPVVDIYREKGNVVVKAEVPGMTKENIKINLTDNSITISGKKEKEEKIEEKEYYRYESSHGSFHRTFSLPEGVETDKAKATFKDGVLVVRLPISEEAKEKEREVVIE